MLGFGSGVQRGTFTNYTLYEGTVKRVIRIVTIFI